jgi:anti-sigma factor RsiW
VNCEPEKVTGYVDGALDAQERERIEAHLAECAECRAQADAERDLRRQLSTLKPETPSETLEARVRRGLARERRPSPWRWLLPVAAVLALLVLWAHGSPAVIATQLAWDHDHCFGKPRLPAKVWTGDPDTMVAWLERNGTRAPDLPEGAAGLALVGGRHCSILGRRVAHVYYTGGDHRLSVYVVPGWVRLGRTREVTRGDKTVRLLSAGGATVGLVSEQAEAVEAFERALTTTYALARVQALLRAWAPAGATGLSTAD